MVDKSSLEVKIKTSKTIKPSKPTPSHLKSYKLSLVDQIHPPYYTIMLLFYSNSTKIPLDIINLKTSLSKTLTEFYPFAGRCNDDFTISCNDQGIPFIQTQVNCNLTDFLNSPNKLDLMHILMPCQDYKLMAKRKPLHELPPLAFQINVFACGGAVLGCYKLHKALLDGTSLANFLKYWAAVASERYDNLVQLQPNLNAAVSVFPPRISKDCPSFQFGNKCEGQVIAKSFIFSKAAIDGLRARAASNDVPKPSRFEALAGFVWEHCMAAADMTGTMPISTEPSLMSFVVNMRPRLNPPLPNTSIGNIFTSVSARAGVDKDLRDIVMQIHAAIGHIKEIIGSYKGENAANALVADIGPLFKYKPGVYRVSSWCHFGLDEVDFGFGKPNWTSPTNGLVASTSRNFVYFVTSGDGIEVWLYLEVKEMQVLLSNDQFLAVASLK